MFVYYSFLFHFFFDRSSFKGIIPCYWKIFRIKTSSLCALFMSIKGYGCIQISYRNYKYWENLFPPLLPDTFFYPMMLKGFPQTSIYSRVKAGQHSLLSQSRVKHFLSSATWIIAIAVDILRKSFSDATWDGSFGEISLKKRISSIRTSSVRIWFTRIEFVLSLICT